MATNTTTYGDGGVNVQTPMGGAYTSSPGQQFATSHEPSMLDQLLRYKQWQQEQALIAAQSAAQVQRPQPMQQSSGGGSGGALNGGGRAQQVQAMSDPGIPNYIKMVGQGPASTPGYIQARAGEPGAVFAGYIPRDALAGPNVSSFQPGGSVSAPAGNEAPPGRTGTQPYEGGGAQGAGADFAREQMIRALARSNAEVASNLPNQYQSGRNWNGNTGASYASGAAGHAPSPYGYG